MEEFSELMIEMNDSQQNIYTKIINEIEELLNALKNGNEENEFEEYSKNGNEENEFKEYSKEAINKLSDVRNEINENIKSLEKDSEWETFTIALYGETNAGKSTLVESLRILLNESRKNEERQNFEQTKILLDSADKRIDENKKAISRISEELEQKILVSKKCINNRKNRIRKLKAISDSNILKIQVKVDDFNLTISEIDEEIAKLGNEKSNLNRVILDKMLSSTWSMLRSWFHKLEEQKEINSLTCEVEQLEKKVYETKSEKESLVNQMENMKAQLINQVQSITNECESFEKEIKSYKMKTADQQSVIKSELDINERKKNMMVDDLKNFSDGAIVGDGKSDFTQTVGKYYFEIKGKSFTILDLPGIEGKEEDVQKAIDSAVNKAHVIFYISKNPTPPQKGDDESLGTIEKISRQLSKNSEVYYIYNKPITSPRPLKEGLISGEESKSLKDVDTVLSDLFGENYASHKYLSAYPAFIALGNYYGWKFDKSKQKFRDRFLDLSKVLDLSLVPNFASWMTGQLIVNVEEKIVNSNYKKISLTLQKTIEEINEIHSTFKRLQNTLSENLGITSDKLDIAGSIYEQSLKNASHQSIIAMKNEMRKKIYADIDKGIDDKSFEQILKKQTKEGVVYFTKTLKSHMDKAGKEFVQEISDIVATFQKHVSELVDKYSNSMDFNFKFNPEINIKPNINVKATVVGIAEGIVGLVIIAVNITNPIGWVELVMSSLAMIWGVYKKIKAALNEDFHKAQQRKNADENIDKVAAEMEKELKKQQSDIKEDMIVGIGEIKKGLNKPQIHVKTMTETFLRVKKDIQKLSFQMNKEIGENHNGNN